jgi:hypothetical protein
MNGAAGPAGESGAPGADGADGADGIGFPTLTTPSSQFYDTASTFGSTPFNVDITGTAYIVGSRVRAVWATDPSVYFEGTITAFDTSGGGNLTVNIDNSSGASGGKDVFNITLSGGLSGDVSINEKTASYTLVLADKNKIVEMGVGSANNLTVPPESSVNFPIGSQINILQVSSGQTTIVAGAGVTINATPGLKMRAQWSYATLIKRQTNTWVLVGDISA